jgi:hypothetical protein
LCAGYTAVIEREQLEALASQPSAALGLPDWEAFKADLAAGALQWPTIRVPFLFAGGQAADAGGSSRWRWPRACVVCGSPCRQCPPQAAHRAGGHVAAPAHATFCCCAGTMLDAPAAAVYQLKEGGQLVGILVSSEAAGQD